MSNNFNGIHFKEVREESKNSTSINANEKGSGNQNTNEKSISSNAKYECKNDNCKTRFKDQENYCLNIEIIPTRNTTKQP